MADNYLEKRYDEYLAEKQKAEKAKKTAWKKRMDAYRKKIAEEAARKKEKYAALAEMTAMIGNEKTPEEKFSETAALIHEAFGFLWTGFYMVADERHLVLGPFCGPSACTEIMYGKGVCGTAWKEDRTIIVPDVDKFSGHIRCSSDARSEIVVPLHKDGKVSAVLDIDSDRLGSFDETDALFLEEICKTLSD